MPLIDIPDIGTVEFPDSMSRDEIKATIKDKILARRKPTLRPVVPVPGAPEPRIRQEPPTPFELGQVPSQVARASQIPAMSYEEAEQLALSPQATISIPEGEPTTALPKSEQELYGIPQAFPSAERRAQEIRHTMPPLFVPGSTERGIAEVAKMPLEMLTAPASPLIATAQVVPGLRELVDTTMSASLIKSGSQRLGEASVSGNKEEYARGVGELVLGTLSARAGVRKSILERRLEQAPVVEAEFEVMPDGTRRPIPPERRIPAAGTGTEPAAAVKPQPLLPRSQDELGKLPGERTTDASQVSPPTEVHGDVRPLETPAEELPVPPGGTGIQPQAEGGLPREDDTRTKAPTDQALGDVTQDEAVGRKLGGITHLVPIITKLSKIYREQGPEAGRAMLELMASEAPGSSGFKQEVETPGFIDDLDKQIRRELGLETKPAPGVAEGKPLILAGKITPDGELIVAREHQAFVQEETAGESVYVVVPSSVDPMMFESNLVRLSPDDQQKLGIKSVTIQEAQKSKGDIEAAAKAKPAPPSTEQAAPTEAPPAAGVSEAPKAGVTAPAVPPAISEPTPSTEETQPETPRSALSKKPFWALTPDEVVANEDQLRFVESETTNELLARHKGAVEDALLRNEPVPQTVLDAYGLSGEPELDKEPWQIRKLKWRNDPRALENVPPFLAISPLDLSQETLAPLKKSQLQVLARIIGAPPTGNKSQITERILQVRDVRAEISNDTVESLEQRMTREKLGELLDTLKVRHSFANKHAKAVILINWRERMRQEGRNAIADARHFQAVEAAIKAGQPVPEFNLKEYQNQLDETDKEEQVTPEPKSEERPTRAPEGQSVAGPSELDVREPARPSPPITPAEPARPVPRPEVPAGAGGGGQAQAERPAGRGGVQHRPIGGTGPTGRVEPQPEPTGPSPAPGATEAPAKPPGVEAPKGPQDLNLVLPKTEEWIPRGDKAKVNANLAAIRLAKQLETENRNPTPEEKGVLAKYTGWGGLKSVFDEGKAAYRERKHALYGIQEQEYNRWEKNWGALYDAVKSELTPEEWDRAARSILNAHYTSRTVINSIWDAIEHMGFRGGIALEPAGGVGHFIGLQPETSRANTKWAAVELDDISGRILTKLYPQAKVQITGFEKARIPNNSLDLVVSNFPFAKQGPSDPRYPALSLHNYFFVRSLDLVKPGGIVAAITSTSTMDNPASRAARDYMAERADLIGAIRLPNNAFKENAGTEVTTDILFFRKRDATPFAGQPFTRTVTSKTYKGEPVEINEYFAAHPEMMLGRMSLEGTMYGGNEPALLPTPGADLATQLQGAIAKLPENVFGAQRLPGETAPEAGEVATGKIGALSIRNGKPVIAQPDGTYESPDWAEQAAKVVQSKHYLGLRDTTQQLIDRMLAPDSSDAELAAGRAELNRLYDDYVRKYGPVNERRSGFLEDDNDFPLVLALEDGNTRLVESKTAGGKVVSRRVTEWVKSKIFTERTIFPREAPARVDTPEDGYQVSMNFRGKVDPDYIAQLTGQDVNAVKNRLREANLAFEHPVTGQWEPAWRYLSGDVKEKLEQARAALADNPQMQANVAALEKVQPEPIAFENISFKLGSTFIPPGIVQRFMREHLGLSDAEVQYNEATGNWLISEGYKGRGEALNTTTYGIHGLTGGEMVALALNLKNPIVTKLETRVGADGRSYDAEVKDTKASLEAAEKQNQVKRAFIDWVKKDPQAARSIEQHYNNTANRSRIPTFEPPSWSQYPGASADISLRNHQMRVVTRMLQESTMLAHAVGTGKTFAMITAAMEMRRLGLAKKPMIVVQNATLEQFARSFKRLYPTSRILVPSSKQRDAKNRNRTMSRIATGDWDAVIIPQSFINMVPDDPVREANFINDQISALKTALIEAKAEAGERAPKAADIQRAINRLEKKLSELAARKKDDILKFDQLGVDALFVDEAHAYKKLQFSTKMENIKGLDTGASQRGLSMFLKVRAVQEKNQGRNVIFATGTPVSNTIAEVYTMMRYLRPDILKRFDIEDFDSFAANFGDTITNLEMTAGGTWKPVTRFARYTNGPELIAAWRSVADVVTPEEINLPGLPAIRGGKAEAIVIKQTPTIAEYVQVLRAELEAFERMSGKEKRDNSHIPLVVFGRAKKATLDMRLIDSALPDEPGNKLNRVADEVARIHRETAGVKGAQMVFADLYQNPDGKFNLYDDLKRKLIKRGIPEHEILIVTDDLTESKRETAFQKLNDGEIRVAIGSTERMGVGVNAQAHLAALHHMDAPARPMDVEQRNGRIWRQGNQNPIVDIKSYGVENTLDAALFQRLATKQKFINQILRGDLKGRNFEDAANEVSLSFEEQMAAFSGDPLALEKVTLENQIRNLEGLRSAHYEQVRQGREQIDTLTRTGIPYTERALEQAKQESARARDEFGDLDKVQLRYGDRVFTGKKEISKFLDEKFNTALEAIRKKVAELSQKEDAERWLTSPIPGFKIGTWNINLDVSARSGKIWLDPAQTKQGWGIISSYIDWNVKDVPGRSGRVTTGNGFFTSLDSVLRGIDRQPQEIQSNLESKRRELIQLQSFVTKPFEREAELSAAKIRYADVLNKIQKGAATAKVAKARQEVAPLGFEVTQFKPEEAQRTQIRRILDTIENARAERHLPEGYKGAIVNALQQRLGEIEAGMLEAAQRAGQRKGAIIPGPQPYEPSAQALGIRPGVSVFIREDVLPGIQAAVKGITESVVDLRNALSPALAGPSARLGAGIIREQAARLAQKDVQMREAFAEAHRAMAKMDKAATLDWLDAVETGARSTLTGPLKVFADEARKQLDTRRRLIQGLGTGKLQHFIQDYFPHLWKNPKTGLDWILGIFGRRPLRGRASFLKHRTIPTTRQGVDAGLEPVSWNPMDILLAKLHEMDRYIMGQQIFNEFKDKGLAQFSRSDVPPEGYAKINDNIANVIQYRPTVKKDGSPGAPERILRGHYFVQEDAARVLNNYLSPGLQNFAVYKALRWIGNNMNMATLGLSGYHGLFTMIDAGTSKLALGIEQAARGDYRALGTIPRGLAGTLLVNQLEAFYKGSKVLQEYTKPGSVGGDFTKIVDALIAGGGRVSMPEMFQNSTLKNFFDAIGKGNYPGAILRAPFAAIHAAAYPLMNIIVPRLKLGVFFDMAKAELERLGPAADRDTVRAAMGRIWDSVDNRMGEVVYDNLFWDKRLKDISHLLVRSVGWNLGTLREIGGGVIDTATVLKRLKNGDPVMTRRMAYTIAIVFTTALMGALYMKLRTGKDPEELEDLLAPRTGNTLPEGQPERVHFPTYLKDIESVKRHPVQTAINKAHPMWGTIAQMLQNKDFYGTEIVHPGDPLMERIKDELKYIGKAFIPYSASGATKRGEIEPGLEPKIESFFGIMPVPAELTRTPAENLAMELMRGHQPKAARTKEVYDRLTKERQAIQQIKMGKMTLEQAEEKGLVKEERLREVEKRVESSYLEYAMKRLSPQEAMRVLEKAKPSEVEKLADELEGKINRAKSIEPEEKDRLIEMLDKMRMRTTKP